MRRPHRLRWMIAAATATLVLSACSAPDETVAEDHESTTQPPATAAPAATTTTTFAPASSIIGVRFDWREPSDVFALVQVDGGGVGAGFGSSLEPAPSLPADANHAVPDGLGGVVYVSGDQVWWLDEPNGTPESIEEPGIPVKLVGLRHIEGDPTVLVLIGDKLIGYSQGRGRLGYAFDEFSGDILDLAVDGDLAVAVVHTADGNAVELVSLLTGVQSQLLAPIHVDAAAAPLRVSISDDLVAVLRKAQPVQILTTEGSEVGSVNLGIEDLPISSIDLAGERLLVAFGEAATITNIFSGHRVTADTPRGWVIGATWADPPTAVQPPITATVTRFRVDTEKVEADTNDPYLNVRRGPGAQNDLYAKLPAIYTGLRWTGDEETSDDGGLWYLVELLDPIQVTPGEPLHGAKPMGWVNSAFLEPLPEGLPVTTADIPACVQSRGNDAATSGTNSPTNLHALESAYLSPTCLRIVASFGTGELDFSMDRLTADVGPATAVPEVFENMYGGSGGMFDLGGIESAWYDATETEHGVYVVVREGRLQLWTTNAIADLSVHPVSERGQVVIDVAVDTERPTPPAGHGVVLTQEPWPGQGSTTIWGIARPFESWLGVTVEDGSGDTVEAVFSGSLDLGTRRATEYGVSAVGWERGWAPFAVRVEGLPPGDYTTILSPEGGADNPQDLRVPFTMPDYPSDEVVGPQLATDAEHEAVTALVYFAKGNVARTSVPFADEVILGLNTVEQRTVPRSQLSEPEAWIADLKDFDGFVGDFSALATLARSDFVRITTGPINHCAGPPLDWPAEFDDLRQVNIEPIKVDSCMQWFGISVFLNSSEEIEAVVLDLFGP